MLCIATGFADEFMKVADHKVQVDGKHCYLVRKGYSWRDKAEWEPYCGVIDDFWYESGYPYTLQVDKYDLKADTIHLIKPISRSSSSSYNMVSRMLKLKAERNGLLYMKVGKEKVDIDGRNCYHILGEYGKKDTTKLNYFCGEFKFVENAEGYSLDSLEKLTEDSNSPLRYSAFLQVDEYTPESEVICVKNIIVMCAYKNRDGFYIKPIREVMCDME